MTNKNRGFCWECNLCRCTWSGGIDIDEMRDHYMEEHPEVDVLELIDETDFMTRRVISAMKSKRKSLKKSSY